MFRLYFCVDMGRKQKTEETCTNTTLFPNLESLPEQMPRMMIIVWVSRAFLAFDLDQFPIMAAALVDSTVTLSYLCVFPGADLRRKLAERCLGCWQPTAPSAL